MGSSTRFGLATVLLAGIVLLSPVCARASQLVFVTSSSHDGNFGGLAGGDGICDGLAAAAGLKGQWVAWLSNAGINGGDRIVGDGPFVSTNGTQIAADKAALLSGTLDNAISSDENGVGIGAAADVWTGTTAAGARSGSTCSGWNDNGSGSGTFGNANQTDSDWSDVDTDTCSDAKRIYCFQLPLLVAPAPVLSAPFKVLTVLLLVLIGGLGQLRLHRVRR
ncbi:MAG: hypothetical protein HY270_10400 [Deltaproteobacteria bacterium]|nr:hypothetical protein [Deltaproteobacteria bacterium]